jgi:RHS repeat-associated protein
MRILALAVVVFTLEAGTVISPAVEPAQQVDDDVRPPELLATHPVTVKPLNLSRPPTTTELISAGQLGGPLFPTHEPGDRIRYRAERWEFGKAIEEWNRHEYLKAAGMFRQYLRDYPGSPWAAEAELHIGCDATYNGRYTEAETIFNRLISTLEGREHAGARLLVNKARQRLALLHVEHNELELASAHFQLLLRDSPDARQRTYASHWIQKLARFRAAKEGMATCGARALAYALEKQGYRSAAAQVRTNIPATVRGHSLAALIRISGRHGIQLEALQAAPNTLGGVPTPAILQVRGRTPAESGHYWVLDRNTGERLELYDPQTQRRFHQTVAELGAEWSGRLLVFASGGTLPGRRLTLEEAEEASGGCCGVPRKEDELGDFDESDDNNNDDDCSQGFPAWKVNVVNMNLFVTDTPLWYRPPVGPPVRISLSYNSQSAIARNEPFGGKWQFNYGSYLVVDTAGTVVLFMPDGRRDMFTPDGNGGYTSPYQVRNTLTRIAPNHFELRFPEDTVYVYQIPAGTDSQQPFLTEIRDAHGRKLTFGYDAEVHLTTIRDARGLVTTLTYNADGLVTAASDPFGRAAAFEYTGGALTRVRDMGGYEYGFTYDSNLYLTGITDQRGTWSFRIEPADGINNSSNPYPPPGDVMYDNYRITITDPLGHPREYHYNGYSGYAWYVSPRDYVPWTSFFQNNFKSEVPKTTYHFLQMDSGRQGEVSQITLPNGASFNYEHDGATGDLTSRTDAHGHRWEYEYNAMGRPAWVRDPEGNTTSIVYAANGVDPITVSDPLGQVSMTWDARHNLLSRTDRLNQTVNYTYNDLGQITTETDALQVTTTYIYDSGNRLAQVQRAGLTIASFGYDAIGRMTSHTDEAGLTLAYHYNSLDQVIAVTHPDGRSHSYTYSTCCPRLLDSVTDRGGRTTTYTYDALKRVVRRANSEGGLTHYGYDENGNITRLVDPNGNATTFGYDVNNRLIRKTYADGRSVAYGYDAAGLLVTRTNARGSTVRYTYDTNHRPTTIAYSDGTPGVTIEYDRFGRAARVTDDQGASSFTYDANSRVLSFTGPRSGDTVTYSYDAAGRGTNLVLQGSPPTAYDYDALHRLTGVRVGPQAYGYTYAGAETAARRLDRPGGSHTTYAYDSLKRLTQVSNRRATGEIINEFGYLYNDQDLRATETVSNGPPVSFPRSEVVRYEYNALNQVRGSASPASLFGFDEDGNMTRGLTPAGDVFTASYDAENRMTSLAFTNATGMPRRTEYAYSGLGRLRQLRSFTNGVLSEDRRFLVSGFQVLRERDGRDNRILREYTWSSSADGGIGRCLHLQAAGADYSYLYDGKGNVAAVLQKDQTLAAHYAYGPFGELATSAGSLNQPLRFSTKPYEEGSGLSHFGHRFYSAATGKWTTRDPLGEKGGLNLYVFVGNNPVSQRDPLGLNPLGDIDWPEVPYTTQQLHEWARNRPLDPDGQAWERFMKFNEACRQSVTPQKVADTFQKIEDTVVRNAPAASAAAAAAMQAITSALEAAVSFMSNIPVVVIFAPQIPTSAPGGPTS